MLGTTLSFIVIMALIAGVLLDGIASFARAGVQAAADHVVSGAVDDATARYQQMLANAIGNDRADAALEASGTFTGTPPPVAVLTNASSPPATLTLAPTPAPSASASNALRFAVGYIVTPTTIAPPHCPASTAAHSATRDVVAWLQCDGYVQESRMSLRVTVRVYDAAASQLLVQREQYVSLRLFAAPPYSAVVGRTDNTAADPLGRTPATMPHEGDVGGDTVSGAAVPPPSPYPSGGTLIHVQYVCQPGTTSCAQAAPSDPDLHLQQNAGWTNGNP